MQGEIRGLVGLGRVASLETAAIYPSRVRLCVREGSAELVGYLRNRCSWGGFAGIG